MRDIALFLRFGQKSSQSFLSQNSKNAQTMLLALDSFNTLPVFLLCKSNIFVKNCTDTAKKDEKIVLTLCNFVIKYK